MTPSVSVSRELRDDDYYRLCLDTPNGRATALLVMNDAQSRKDGGHIFLDDELRKLSLEAGLGDGKMDAHLAYVHLWIQRHALLHPAELDDWFLFSANELVDRLNKKGKT